MSGQPAELPRALRVLIGSVVAKRYVVDGFLGMGGMAVAERLAWVARSVSVTPEGRAVCPVSSPTVSSR